jgi:parallel beta-helix repeat protein
MRKLFVLATTVAVAGLMTLGGEAQAIVACGDTIVASTTLTNSLTGCGASGLVIGASNITLNCNGHSIAGTGGGIGISVAGMSKVRIENCHVQDFGDNFFLQSSTSNKLINNTSVGNSAIAGFLLFSSTQNTLTGNIAINGTAVGTSRGFLLDSTSNQNKLTSNVAIGNVMRGFDVGGSMNTFTKNTALNNGSAGFVLSGSSNIYKSNRAISNESEGFIVFPNGANNTFKGNQASSNGGNDCSDSTVGSGTASTANTWTGNIGDTSAPAGLCFP